MPDQEMLSDNAYFGTRRPEVVEFLPQTYTRVLEIGCGYGHFRHNLKHESVEYWGIEPYSNAAHIAATKLAKVLVGTYEHNYQQLPDDYFDLVICNDVIEHMPDHDF